MSSVGGVRCLPKYPSYLIGVADRVGDRWAQKLFGCGPKERRKSEALGRIEKKPKESKKTRKTEDKHIIKPKCVRVLKYVDIRQ